MKGRDVLFSKTSDEYETPGWLFRMLDAEFHFDLDAAATHENTLAPGFFTKEENALVNDWYVDYVDDGYISKVFVNPPYSQIGAFMKKAYEEANKGAVVVCLIPVRSDTAYWHDYIMKAKEIRFVRGRLKFGNRTMFSGNLTSATFPSCVVVFDIMNTEHYVPTISAILQPVRI